MQDVRPRRRIRIFVENLANPSCWECPKTLHIQLVAHGSNAIHHEAFLPEKNAILQYLGDSFPTSRVGELQENVEVANRVHRGPRSLLTIRQPKSPAALGLC